jgi:hypothetical protein
LRCLLLPLCLFLSRLRTAILVWIFILSVLWIIVVPSVFLPAVSIGCAASKRRVEKSRLFVNLCERAYYCTPRIANDPTSPLSYTLLLTALACCSRFRKCVIGSVFVCVLAHLCFFVCACLWIIPAIVALTVDGST